MADGILGLGSEGSASLNQELIDDLKTKESEALIDPLDTQLEELEKEMEVINEIEAKTNELLETMKPFDLYYNDGNNIFNEVSATTSGEAASFDATDTSGLTPGTTYIQVDQLATKDVYQSDKISSKADEIMNEGQNEGDSLGIEVDGQSFTFYTKDKTYEEFAQDITKQSNNTLVASVEQVSDDEFRLVIKSAQTGESNKLNITQNGSLDMGFEKSENHTLEAQNMIATIDGVDYNTSSNTIVTQGGLSITGVKVGESSITIKQDTQVVMDSILLMAQQYNELNDLLSDATLNAESPVQDKASLRAMQNEIKAIFLDTYGLNEEESLFAYGISFDTNGYMIINQGELSKALNDNYSDLEELFVGYAEEEGIGTKMKTYLDDLDGFNGSITTYEENMEQRKTDLEEEKKKAQEDLDAKYAQMQDEFAQATVAITQMEAQFASLKATIDAGE